MSLLVAAIELLPAPGFGGGRLLVARHWRRTGDRDRAVLAAADTGTRAAWVMLAAGLLATLLLGGAGIWLLLFGGVTLFSSRLARARALARIAVSGLTARELMAPPPPTVWALQPVAALDEVVLPARVPAVLVRDEVATFAGVALLRDLAAVPADDRDLVRVGRVMVPAAAVPVVTVDTPVESWLDAAALPAAGLVVVVDPGRGPDHVAGVIGVAELVRGLETAPLRGRPPVFPGRRV